MTAEEAPLERKPEELLQEEDNLVLDELEELEAAEGVEALEEIDQLEDPAKSDGPQTAPGDEAPTKEPAMTTELPEGGKVVGEIDVAMTMPPGYNKWVIIAKNDANQVQIKMNGFINDDEAFGFISRQCNPEFIVNQITRQQQLQQGGN